MFQFALGKKNNYYELHSSEQICSFLHHGRLLIWPLHPAYSAYNLVFCRAFYWSCSWKLKGQRLELDLWYLLSSTHSHQKNTVRLNFKRLMWQISLDIVFIRCLSLCIDFQTIQSLGNAGNRAGTGTGFLLDYICDYSYASWQIPPGWGGLGFHCGHSMKLWVLESRLSYEPHIPGK